MDHTVLPANNTMPAFPLWRSPDVTTTATEAADVQLQLTNHLSTRKDERLSWPSWLLPFDPWRQNVNTCDLCSVYTYACQILSGSVKVCRSYSRKANFEQIHITLSCIVYVVVTLTRSRVKVKVTGHLDFRKLLLWLQVGRKKPCMLAAMTVSLLAGPFIYRLDALPDAQPTMSKHGRQYLQQYCQYCLQKGRHGVVCR